MRSGPALGLGMFGVEMSSSTAGAIGGGDGYVEGACECMYTPLFHLPLDWKVPGG